MRIILICSDMTIMDFLILPNPTVELKEGNFTVNSKGKIQVSLLRNTGISGNASKKYRNIWQY